jgi:ribonuclease P protein component
MRDTLKSKQAINKVFGAGKKTYTPGAVIFWQEVPVPGAVAVVAGKKLGCAPLRSRCKRRLRAAWREIEGGKDVFLNQVGGIGQGRNIVLVATRRTPTLPFRRLCEDIRKSVSA